jgi:hypothetical protein
MHSKILHPAIITHVRATDVYVTKYADRGNGLSMMENTNLMLLITPNIFENSDKTKSTL